LGLSKKGFLKIFCITLLFLGLIVAWLAFGEGGFIHLYRMEKERQAYLERIRILEEEKQNLLEQINRLRSDEEYIESEARKELGLLRENEVIYRFDREADKTEQGQDKETSDKKQAEDNQP
jgi:cell division protein FtsB